VAGPHLPGASAARAVERVSHGGAGPV
jgi:hypothetical protein